MTAAARSGDGVLWWLNAEQDPLSAHPRSLVVSAVNGFPHRLGALQHTAVSGDSTGTNGTSTGSTGDSTGEFITVTVGVVDS